LGAAFMLSESTVAPNDLYLCVVLRHFKFPRNTSNTDYQYEPTALT